MERLALEQVSEGILFLSLNCDKLEVEYFNNAASNILGEKIYFNFLDKFQNTTDFINSVTECIKTNKTHKKTYLLRDAKYRTVACTFVPSANKCIVSLASTDEKFEYFNIFDHLVGIATAIFEYYQDIKDWKFLFMSKTGSQRWNIDSNDAIGKFAIKDMGFRRDWIEKIGAAIETLTKKFQSASVEMSLSLPNTNATRVVRVDLLLADYSSEGRPILFSNSTDITEMKNVEAELEEKQKKLEEIDEVYRLMKNFFEYSDLSMGTVDLVNDGKDLQVVIMNPCAKRQWIHDKQSVNDSALSEKEKYKNYFADLWLQKYHECARVQHPIRFETHNEMSGNSFSNLIVQISKDRFCWLSMDISERHKLEKQLQEHKESLEETVKERTKELEDALHVKNRFLATMSHELRTPLSGINGAIELLSETPLTPDQFQTVNIANICTQQLLLVINDILDLSKLEENKLSLEKIPCSLLPIIEEAVEIVSFDAEKKKLEIVCDIHPSAPYSFIGDQIRLRQILVNLLTNAVKFSEKGNIVLGVKASSPFENGKLEILFYVKDEGVGISEEARAFLFQPFTQGDSSTSRRYGGSGLGLSICKRLCAMMEGRIWFESLLNEGSTFYFTITAQPMERRLSLEDPIHLESQQRKVLIIEENEALAKLMKSIIEEKWECSSLSSVEEAKNFLNRNAVNIIICDCNSEEITNELVSLWSRSFAVVLLGFTEQLRIWRERKDVILLRKPIRKKSIFTALLDAPLNGQSPKHNKIKATRSRVLVAEDNKLNQQIVGKMLASFGFDRIEFADNGKLAVEAFSKAEFEIILMDIMMPEMGGIEATNLIRNLKKRQPVIIALTADVLFENHGGFDDILIKPVNKAKFGEMLHKYVEKFEM